MSGRKTVLRLPLLVISARSVCTASAVIKRSSDTRMPVAQMVYITRDSRSLSRRWAADTRRAYSARVSSWCSSQNRDFWIFSSFTAHSRQPMKFRKPLRAASMEFTVVGGVTGG